MDKYFNVYCGGEIINDELLTEAEAEALAEDLLMNGQKKVDVVDIRNED